MRATFRQKIRDDLNIMLWENGHVFMKGKFLAKDLKFIQVSKGMWWWEEEKECSMLWFGLGVNQFRLIGRL